MIHSLIFLISNLETPPLSLSQNKNCSFILNPVHLSNFHPFPLAFLKIPIMEYKVTTRDTRHALVRTPFLM